MRVLALLALALGLALPADAAAPHAAPVPILEYHVVGTPAPGAPNQGLYVDAATFRGQMGWLAAHGWHADRLDDVLAYWRTGRPLPSKPVVLTFDDGYPQDWQTAMPVLRAHGFVGNLNLQVGNLVPLHVRQLLHAGWEVDAHTFTHPDLTRVGAAQLAREVGGSRAWIRRVFHVPCEAFTYPAGRYDPTVLAAVRRAGFVAGETENRGWAAPGQGLLSLDRIEVTSSYGVAGVAAALAHA